MVLIPISDEETEVVEPSVSMDLVDEGIDIIPLDDILRETISVATLNVEAAIETFNGLGINVDTAIEYYNKLKSGLNPTEENPISYGNHVKLLEIYQTLKDTLYFLIIDARTYPAIKAFLIEKKDILDLMIALMKNVYAGKFDSLSGSWDAFVTESLEY